MSEKKVILVVDDESANIRIIGDILSLDYEIRAATSGSKAIHSLSSGNKVDLILLDVKMPEMDGYEVLKNIHQHTETHDIPVIFVTSMNDVGNEEKGLSLGAADYITKPVSPPILKARVKTHLAYKLAQDKLKDQNLDLKHEVDKKNIENQMIRDVGMRALSSLAKTRDNETGNHILRTQAYINIFARHLAKAEKYKGVLTEGFIETIVKSAPLHDVGKVGIADNILLKPGALTATEFSLMKEHAKLGADALKDCMQGSECDIEINFLSTAIDIAHYHHEKWNGQGYPEGLSGEDIPLPARLMALADVFDALISARCYKPAFSMEKSIQIIHEGRGSHFQPEIVDALDENLDQVMEIVNQYIDEEIHAYSYNYKQAS